jgi:hypothetical protein
MGFPVVVWLTGSHRSALGTSRLAVLWGLSLVGAQTKAGQGLKDDVDVDGRGVDGQ